MIGLEAFGPRAVAREAQQITFQPLEVGFHDDRDQPTADVVRDHNLDAAQQLQQLGANCDLGVSFTGVCVHT